MGFKDDLAQRSASPAVIFHKFRTAKRPDTSLHLFLEGYEDVIYYERILSELKGLFGSPWKTYLCLGKRNMDQVIRLFYDSPFKNDNVLFIRDSDFDRFLGRAPIGDKVFLTCGYAVENYVCSTDAVYKFIRSNFGIDTSEVDIGALCDAHKKAMDTLFVWLSTVFGAAIYAVRNDHKIDLNQLNIDTYYSDASAGNDLPDPITLREIQKAGLLAEHFNDDSAALGASYTSLDSINWIRGKYLLDCTCVFIKREYDRLLAEYKAGHISRFNRKLNPDFSANAVFERLSALAPPPKTLKDVLSSALTTNAVA